MGIDEWSFVHEHSISSSPSNIAGSSDPRRMEDASGWAESTWTLAMDDSEVSNSTTSSSTTTWHLTLISYLTGMCAACFLRQGHFFGSCWKSNVHCLFSILHEINGGDREGSPRSRIMMMVVSSAYVRKPTGECVKIDDDRGRCCHVSICLTTMSTTGLTFSFLSLFSAIATTCWFADVDESIFSRRYPFDKSSRYGWWWCCFCGWSCRYRWRL